MRQSLGHRARIRRRVTTVAFETAVRGRRVRGARVRGDGESEVIRALLVGGSRGVRIG